MNRSYAFPVDRTTILMFASALGETNRIYYDEEYAQRTPLAGVIAPPTFPMAANHWNPSFGLRGVRRIPPPPQAEPRDESDEERRIGGGRLTRVLHGEQRFEYHKPLRPGMQLLVTTRAGRTWQKQGKRGGTLRFTEAIDEFRDEAGELVITATSVGVETSKVVED